MEFGSDAVWDDFRLPTLAMQKYELISERLTAYTFEISIQRQYRNQYKRFYQEKFGSQLR